jgi:hypothetical protein
MPSCSYFEADLNGEIFIVTKGRENVRLALVEISAIPEKDIIPFINKKISNAKREIEKSKPAYEKLVAEEKSLDIEYQKAFKRHMDHISSRGYDKEYDAHNKKFIERLYASDKYFKFLTGKYYFDGIPKAENICKSNVDGKFSLKLKRNSKYALFAKSSRKVFDSEEDYYWLIWVVMDHNPQSVTLSNDNLIDTYAHENIINMKELLLLYGDNTPLPKWLNLSRPGIDKE